MKRTFSIGDLVYVVPDKTFGIVDRDRRNKGDLYSVFMLSGVFKSRSAFEYTDHLERAVMSFAGPVRVDA